MHGFVDILNNTTIPLVFRVSALAVAFAMSNSPWGVLNRLPLPLAVRVLLTCVLLDLFLYVNHHAQHSVPLLWRLHQMHHTDGDVDLSTGLRFHPGDVFLTQAAYLVVVAVLAPPPIGVLCAELFNLAQAMFSHGNVTLPPRLESMVRLVLVTPEFHRVHHSINAAEQRSNLGVLFSFWDRLFHTYRHKPEAGEEGLRFGLEEVTAAQSVQPLTMLALPFAAGPRPNPQHHGILQADGTQAQ